MRSSETRSNETSEVHVRFWGMKNTFINLYVFSINVVPPSPPLSPEPGVVLGDDVQGAGLFRFILSRLSRSLSEE